MSDALGGSYSSYTVIDNLYGIYTTTQPSGVGVILNTPINNFIVGYNCAPNLKASSIGNTIIGIGQSTSLSSASNNTSVGYNALDSITSGNAQGGTSSASGGNSAYGVNALQNATGDYNTAVGINAGDYIAAGYNNSFFGARGTALTSGIKLTNCMAIGYDAGTSNSAYTFQTNDTGFCVFGNKAMVKYLFSGVSASITVDTNVCSQLNLFQQATSMMFGGPNNNNLNIRCSNNSGTINMGTSSSTNNTINIGMTGSTVVVKGSSLALTGPTTISGGNIQLGSTTGSGTMDIRSGATGTMNIGVDTTGQITIGNTSGNTTINGSLLTNSLSTVGSSSISTFAGNNVTIGATTGAGTTNIRSGATGTMNIGVDTTGVITIGNASGSTTMNGTVTASTLNTTSSTITTGIIPTLTSNVSPTLSGMVSIGAPSASTIVGVKILNYTLGYANIVDSTTNPIIIPIVTSGTTPPIGTLTSINEYFLDKSDTAATLLTHSSTPTTVPFIPYAGMKIRYVKGSSSGLLSSNKTASITLSTPIVGVDATYKYVVYGKGCSVSYTSGTASTYGYFTASCANCLQLQVTCIYYLAGSGGNAIWFCEGN